MSALGEHSALESEYGAHPAPLPGPLQEVALTGLQKGTSVVVGRRRIVSAGDWVTPLYPHEEGEPLSVLAYGQPYRVHFFPDPQVTVEPALRRAMFADVAQPSMISKRAHPYLVRAHQVAVRGRQSMARLFRGVGDADRTPVLYELDLVAGRSLSSMREELKQHIEEGVRDLDKWRGYFETAPDAPGARPTRAQRRFFDDPGFQSLQLLIECWRTVLWHLANGLEFGCFTADAVLVQSIVTGPWRERRLVPRFQYRGLAPATGASWGETWVPDQAGDARGEAGVSMTRLGKRLSDALMSWVGLDPQRFELTWYAPERFPRVEGGRGAPVDDDDRIRTPGDDEGPDEGLPLAGESPAGEVVAPIDGREFLAEAKDVIDDHSEAGQLPPPDQEASPFDVARYLMFVEFEQYANRDKHHIPQDFVDPFDDEVAFALYFPEGSARSDDDGGDGRRDRPGLGVRREEGMRHPDAADEQWRRGREAEWGRRLLLGEGESSPESQEEDTDPDARPRAADPPPTPAERPLIPRSVAPPVLIAPFNVHERHRDDLTPTVTLEAPGDDAEHSGRDSER